MPENIEEVNSKIATPYMPFPPPNVPLNPESDCKQPDSSNENDGIVDPMLQRETILFSQKSTSLISGIDSLSKSLDTTAEENIDATHLGKSIQVAEISSSEIEENGELENKKTEETTDDQSETLDDENKEIENQSENGQLNDLVQIPNLSNSKLNQFTEPKNSSKEMEISNMRHNQVSDISEAVQSVPLGNRLRSNSGILKNRLRQSDSAILENKNFNHVDVRGGMLNGCSRHKKQHSLFSTVRTDVRAIRRRHSMNSQTQDSFVDSTPSDRKTYISMRSRYKIPITKASVVGITRNERTEDAIKKMVSRASNGAMCGKRRHSPIVQAVMPGFDNNCVQQESCVKRRTRSEDLQNPTDENDPANQDATEDANSRLSWPTLDSTLSKNGTSTIISGQDKISSSNTYQRRSLGKKATPIKTIRRPSINGSSRLQQLRGSFGLREWDQGRNNRTNSCNDRRLSRTVAIIGSPDTTMPQRWLRYIKLYS